ncbi:MAG TPA: sulfurtransferase TusA family protein [Bacteroidales bacterium]|nr:sulfurtransferase TusA family protein [Bacteroidales bacterium]HRZ49315.1 sulfurtransferase TusA family protein [Bacteroidales bacterium]
MKTVNAQGMPCPLPLVMTRKALETLEKGESLEILIDSENARNNVTRFLQDHQMTVQTSQDGKMYRLLVEQPLKMGEDVRPEDYCTT